MTRTWRIAGINFDHFHMGDLLRMAAEHPSAEIVGVADDDLARIAPIVARRGIPAERVFADYRQCLEQTKPDLVILCPAAARHGDWVEKVAPYGVHIVVEKPFAGSLAEADRMIAAQNAAGKLLAINWPLRWVPAHVTAKRLVDEGIIGDVIEVHFYDGNRGPLYHSADKVKIAEAEVTAQKASSWFYKASAGGGSLQDYLGYGTTLGTWYLNGRKPIEVTCVVDEPRGLEVDEHSITIARYEFGLSKFETRWGTFTDPWTHQPQPRCGFVLVGRAGTIASYDYGQTIRVQTRSRPEGFEVASDTLAFPLRNPIEYVLNCIETGKPLEGPLSTEISRIGQQIVDTAVLSSQQKRAVPLVNQG
ncbi:Gfo/Idh/MocA family protein [Humisphaera borealis]|uniref:Gfo/Idh/MocA family oxidoreductase n=1 Tax=Humisphaera borealis TaxID=2807512 RepID=A0A7M2WWT3_9BACT|nr:Gfo/Idh/MocA family oxidoreductase [Humisphaera borealis]QOV89863.1 Gfo/Idh/MocA family oxidoreductase [Humisphaera borealis]